MITPFGRHLRILRMDKNITLREMADYFNVSPAYLSAVERGKKKITGPLFAGVCKMLELCPLEREMLKKAAEESQKIVKLENPHCQYFPVLFAQKWMKLSSEERQAISLILNRH